MNQRKPGGVLVTGATGFAAGHCICDLLEHGYDVRGTVRNLKAPKHEDELVRPAVDGTTRVLTAAAKAGVRRVVCTSSVDVVTRNGATADRQRTDADWSDLAECNSYAKSKFLPNEGPGTSPPSTASNSPSSILARSSARLCT